VTEQRRQGNAPPKSNFWRQLHALEARTILLLLDKFEAIVAEIGMSSGQPSGGFGGFGGFVLLFNMRGNPIPGLDLRF
jgi:hypothetical protein